MRFGWLGLAALLGVGCNPREADSLSAPGSRVETARFTATNPWVLTCADPQAHEPALLWNGVIGLRLGRDGGPLAPGGNRLPLFFAKAYDQLGEEKIQTLENPLLPAPTVGGFQADLTKATLYSQDLDMRTGVLVSSWTQATEDGAKYRVRHEVILHPERLEIAERWSYQISGSDGVGRLLKIPEPQSDPVLPGDSLLFEISRSQANRADSDKQGSTAYVARVTQLIPKGVLTSGLGRGPTYDQVRKESDRIWHDRWKTDILVDGPVEDQLAIHSFLFYLRSAIAPGLNSSISPFGLSGNTYSGHVFWDADMWVFPALALIDPAEAKTIPAYRLERSKQAQVNFEQWAKTGRPTVTINLGAVPSPGFGLKYPWESSVSGKETMPGPSRYEDHVTGSVAFSLAEAAALGLAPTDRVQSVLSGARQFYELRSQPGKSGREIDQTISPDEYHSGNNDLYTNLLADWLFAGGNWSDKPIFKIPQDANGIISYDNDSFMGYQQAAAVMSIYPLQYPPAESQAKRMMARFSKLNSKFGPAMSSSINATIWARLGEGDEAYKAWKDSWQPFVSGPLGIFTEKISKSNGYFTTGAAGSLQSVLYGFLGFRLDSKYRPSKGWSVRLIGDRVLSETPHIPRPWKRVKLTNFTVLGKRYTLTITQAPNGGTSQITPGD